MRAHSPFQLNELPVSVLFAKNLLSLYQLSHCKFKCDLVLPIKPDDFCSLVSSREARECSSTPSNLSSKSKRP